MRQIIVAHTADEMLALRSRWEYLQARCPSTIFQSFKWNWIAAKSFADREPPYVVFAETSSGMALLPLCINLERRKLSCLGDVLFDYRDVLAIGEDTALLAAWDTVARLGVPFSSGGLEASFHAKWAGFHLNPFYRAPQVKCSEISADRFAVTHTRSASRLRRLERMGVVFAEHTPASPAVTRWIYEQKAAQPPEAGENVFSDARRIEFMNAVASNEPHDVEAFTFEIAGKCIAALVTLREHRCRRFYTIWFDLQWAKHSPGISLIYEVTRRSLDQGLNCDYMTGEQDYKMRLATFVEPLYWIEASAEELRMLPERRSAVAA